MFTRHANKPLIVYIHSCTASVWIMYWPPCRDLCLCVILPMIEASRLLFWWSSYWSVYRVFKVFFSNSICCLAFPNNYFTAALCQRQEGIWERPVNFCTDFHCSSLYLFGILSNTVFCVHWGALFKHKSFCINLFSGTSFVSSKEDGLYSVSLCSRNISGVLWDGVFSAV